MPEATVGLTGPAEAAIDWALNKMEQEKEVRAMSEQYPAVADALGAVREAEQQLKTIVALCRTWVQTLTSTFRIDLKS